MKISNILVSIIIIFAFSSCSTISFRNTPKQEILWSNLSMQIPTAWKVEIKGNSLHAQNSDKTELFGITAYTFDPARNLSPIQILDMAVKANSIDSPKVPETTVIPFRTFRLSCGEPAAVVVKDLDDNIFSVGYIIASTNSMYHVDFYHTGNPKHMLGFYQKLIESASIKEFHESECKV